ncbi:MAG: UpxY family transcription antiterminator [Candidatus Acidiferrales bacterium]
MIDTSNQTTVSNRASRVMLPEFAECADPQWYAVYTCANHEKRVASQFLERSIEHFLPLYESTRRWADRKKRVQLPLFDGYIFVRIILRDRLNVLRVPSVVKLVGFNGQPAAVSSREMEFLKNTLLPELRAEPHPYLTAGRRVRIVRGALQGAEGILIRKKNASRVVVSMDLIARAASVEVETADVERI